MLGEMLVVWILLWAGWVTAGILYDPVMAPEAKNGAPHTRTRWIVMFAFCETLRGWIWLSHKIEPRSSGKSMGELMAGIFVICSRRVLRAGIRRCLRTSRSSA